MIGKKIVCMRKNAEINCLPRGASGKTCLHRPPCYARFGEFKKNVCTARVEEKNCKRSIDGGKNFLPSRNHDTPGGGNNGPSLTYLFFHLINIVQHMTSQILLILIDFLVTFYLKLLFFKHVWN